MDNDAITDIGGEPVPLVLKPAQRKALKGLAHHLKPVVMIGDAGLSDSVVAEVDRALKAHELVKIRVLGDERAGRVTYMQELAERLGCAPVQVIGKVLVVWRPAPEEVEYAGTGKKRPKRMIPKKRLEARAEQRTAIKRGGAKQPVTVKARTTRRPPVPVAVPDMPPAKRAALVRLVSPGESAPRAKSTPPAKAGRPEPAVRAGRAAASGRTTRAQTPARISKPESALRPPRAEPQGKPAKFMRTARTDDPAPADRPPRRAVAAPTPAGSTARTPATPTPAPARRHSPARPATTLGKLRPAGSSRKGPGRG